MCGICGIVDFSGKPIQKNKIHQMCSAMTHRGPDDEGIYIKGQEEGSSVGLGHRRLSIIDLSLAGHQPMCNEDDSVWIVLNGEIYNYLELSKGLKERGHKFKSNTDTEVIIHLYEEGGEDCVKQLRGMFAFAIWDERRQTLMLARDRPGKKPLLYYHKNNLLCFSSEFSSILSSNLVDKEINLKAIHHYLTFGYIPAPLTIYKDVYKLLPAHFLVFRNEDVYTEQYWSLDYAKKIKMSEEDAANEILRLLKEAVKIRLHSDVPLGAFLSGGIDSSAIVGLMSELSTNRVKTFSIGFDDAAYNELKHAKRVAERFDTDHHEFIVHPKALDVLPLLVDRYGEPYADSSAIPTYYVSQQTKQFVTVALNGDGGDELFAGYERYQAMLLSEIYRMIPLVVRNKIVQRIVNLLPGSVNPKNSLRRIKRFVSGAELPLNQRYIGWVGTFDEKLKVDIYTDEFMREVSDSHPFKFMSNFLDGSNGLDLLDRLLRADTMTYLPNDLLVKVDITSMANSLECRSPFLDHFLMEFTASLPAEFKLKRFIKKFILKKAVKNIVPADNIHRKKMGLAIPVGIWFRGELKELLGNILLSSNSLRRGYFKPDKIRDMVYYHTSGQSDFGFQLWSLLMLELWHQRFKD